MRDHYPRIVTPFDANPDPDAFYVKAIERVLKHLFPPDVFVGEEAADRFHKQLPALCWSTFAEPPCAISFFFCCLFQQGAYRFFYEMISHWAIPGRRINVVLQAANDFTIPSLDSHLYISGEIMIEVNTKKELDVLRQNLPIFEKEIRLGLLSPYQASRILEAQGLSRNAKVVMIQENIISLIRHRPHDFDYDVLTEMQHFLLHCDDSFKEQRSYRHLSRIICVHYLFRKALKASLLHFPDRRYINIKLLRAQLQGRPVLGIAISISFLRDNEILQERHIIHAINSLIPRVTLVEKSFVAERETIYLEVEKKGRISLAEERSLIDELASELKNSIETRLNPIFMPQNEEEIMRDIVTLSGQLRFVRDLPQVIINFNQQTEEQLEFLVIALSIKPIVNYLKQKATFLECFIDRVKTVGSLRKKYPKQASIFRLRILKRPFLRQDHSIDLHKARQEVSRELSRIIGEFRDYNGGMLFKENELFTHLRELLQEAGQENAFLLEDFFYNLTPAVMRSLLSAESLQKLFLLLLETEIQEEYTIQVVEDDDLYVVIQAVDASFKKCITELVSSLDAASCFLQSTEHPTFCLLWRGPSQEQIVKFILDLDEAMMHWSGNALISN